MINPFKQIGEIKKMRDQAMTIQRELQMEQVVDDKNATTTCSADFIFQ